MDKKKMVDYPIEKRWEERLDENEIKLLRSYPHNLLENERQKRQDLIKFNTRIDLSFGFYNDGFIAVLKRLYYRIFVHPFLKSF